MQEKKVIAIFGGSFNPPINSHISLAKEILEKCENIEKIIFVPVSTKYNKEGLVEDKHRLNMLNIICKNEDKLEVSDLELTFKRQLYTIETMDIFSSKYPNHDIYFIMGTDNLKEIDKWKDPERLLGDYKIIALERENDQLEEIINKNIILKDNRNSIIKIEGIKPVNLSSTMVREKIKNNDNVEEYISENVLDYINENNLYRN